MFSYNILFRSRRQVAGVNWLSREKSKRKKDREGEREEEGREEKEGKKGGRGRKSLICCVS